MNNTLIFGNGINRLSKKNISWEVLLENLKESRSFENEALPNTLIYERIVLERPSILDGVLEDEFEVKKKIKELMDDIEPSEIYTKLFSCNFQHYITTNYDYSFINSIVELPEVILPIYEFSSEDIYSIRRIKKIRNTNESNKDFWQIHGEIKKPATIMLGLDHYCGSIGKIDSYIKGGYKYICEGETIEEASIEQKFNNNSFTNSSWIELFFVSDIHIIGFSLDYCENDLWWIFNKRARMKRTRALEKVIKNKIFYYCSSIDEVKKGLLKSLDVDVIVDKLPSTNTPYLDYYKKIIKHFEGNL